MRKPTQKIIKRSPLTDIVMVVAIVEPLSTLPQIYDIYKDKSSATISLLSWLLFMAGSVIWLIYGIKLRDKPLIASGILWVTTELMLIAGIIMYRP